MDKDMTNIIASLNANQQLSGEAKAILFGYCRDFINFASMVNTELDIDNLSRQLSTLTQIESDSSDEIKYSKKDNAIVVSRDKYYKIGDLNNAFAKAVLSMITTFKKEDGTLKSGIEFDMNENKYGTYINSAIEDRIVEFMYGNPDDAIVTLPSYRDTLVMDLESVVGYDKLIPYFLNGQGESLFYDVEKLFGSSEKAENFFNTVEQFGTVSTNDLANNSKLELSYSKDIEFLKTVKNNNKFSQLA